MSEKSSEWREYRIDELGQVVTGHTPLKSVKEYYESNDYTWIKPTDIRKGERYVSETEEYYSQKAYEKYKSALLPPLSTCVVTIGTVGEKICLTHKPCFTNQSINAIIPNREKFDPMFVYYLLKYNLDQVAQRNPGTASGRHHVSKSNISSIIVKAPLKPTQLKISSILARYDDLLENNTRRIKILEEMAQAIYREWFVHFHFPGHENVRMVESELGLIPEGWEVKRLRDVCKLTMGQSPKSEFYNEVGEGLPFHQGVTNFGFRFPVDEIYCTVTNRIAESGDILFSVRAPVGRINLADKKIVIGRGLSAIRHKNGNQLFTYYQLKEMFKEEDTMGGGTIFKAVTKDDMINIKFLSPSNELLKIFERNVEPISSQLENLIKKNVNLGNTRDLLLPKLISGDVDVSEMNIQMLEVEA